MRRHCTIVVQALMLAGLCLTACAQSEDNEPSQLALSSYLTPTQVAVSTSATTFIPDPTWTPWVTSHSMAEEHAVHRAAIESLYRTEDVELLVIKDHTAGGSPSGAPLNSEAAYIQEKPGATIERYLDS